MLMTTCLQPNGCAVTRNRTVGWCMASRIRYTFVGLNPLFKFLVVDTMNPGSKQVAISRRTLNS
jgi:hypothetical protein